MVEKSYVFISFMRAEKAHGSHLSGWVGSLCWAC